MSCYNENSYNRFGDFGGISLKKSQLLKKVLKIVRKSAKLMMRGFTLEEKDSPANIVTSADIAVQNFLCKSLLPLVPNSAFFGEEGNEEVKNAEYLWVVDPIDGTTNFSRGISECAISVALIYKNEAILGVVYSPFRNEMYFAEKGKGAYLNDVRIETSKRGFESSLFCTALCLYKKEYAEQCIDIIREIYKECADIRRFGSCALDMCHLASGKCELFFEFRVYPWDYAGAYLILKEANGIVSSCHGEKLEFDRVTPIVAANNVENYKKLAEVVDKFIPQIPYDERLR